MSILEKLLKKLNVSEFSQLSPEEKDTYRKWDEILSGRKLTDEDVRTFLDAELEDVQLKLVSTTHSTRTDMFLKMKLEFIRKVKVFLNTPEIEKKVLEKQLES